VCPKLIRDLHGQGRTILLHAQQRLPQANLWPYAFVLCSEIWRWTPRPIDSKIPYYLFCGSSLEEPSLKHLHTFGCPAFVLDKALLKISKTNRLLNRSWKGIYLGPSPNHAFSVHMILSLQTGHISCEFHLYFDDMFIAIRDSMSVPLSYWQNKTGLQGLTTQ